MFILLYVKQISNKIIIIIIITNGIFSRSGGEVIKNDYVNHLVICIHPN